MPWIELNCTHATNPSHFTYSVLGQRSQQKSHSGLRLFLELGRGFEFSQRSYPSSLWDTGVSRALPGPHNFFKWEIPHKLDFQNLVFFFLIRELGNTEQAVSSCWQLGGAEWWQVCSLKGMPGEPATGLPSHAWCLGHFCFLSGECGPLSLRALILINQPPQTLSSASSRAHECCCSWRTEILHHLWSCP